MKRLLLILILTLSFQSLAKADDIRDFEIEGMSIGDSLLDYYSEKFINQKKGFPYPNKKYFTLKIRNDPNFKTYDDVQFTVLESDKKYVIEGILGLKNYKNIKECFDKQNEIAEEISGLFLKTKYEKDALKKHRADKTGNSKILNIFFEPDEGGGVKLACTDWSEKLEIEKNYTDDLSISIASEKLIYWFRNEAYN